MFQLIYRIACSTASPFDTGSSACSAYLSSFDSRSRSEHTMASLLYRPLASFHDVFRKLTWKLFLIWMLTSILNIMFGYDTTAFSGIQSNPAFAREYGSLTPKHTYALSASRASFMSSVAFAGKLLGCFVSLPADRGIQNG